jgi:protein O-mannosyl-transferase
VVTESSSSERETWWRRAGPALAAAALALALYAITLGGTYVYDDVFIVTEDERLHDPSRWGEYWTTDYFAGGLDKLYRPLVSLSYAVQWWLHGDRPWVFHAVNWVLHAVVSALVAELARRLAGAKAAYVAGLLFAAHPVHVEAVANVVGRSELMCAAGVLGALVLMARRPLTVGRAAGIYGCFVLALLSKEQGMLLPLILLLMAGARRVAGRERDAPPTGTTPARERQVALWLAFLLCGTLAGYIVFRENMLRFWWDREQLDWVMNPLVRSRGADRWLMPLVLLGRYAALLVAPAKLSIDYGATVIGWEARWSDPYLWAGVVALGVWVALLVASVVRRAAAAAFCLLALAVTYGLVSNLPTLIGTIFNERLIYLPSAFFLVLLGIGAARLPRRATAAGLVVLLALASGRTFTYARRWNDRLAFYEASLRERPRGIQLYLLLSSEHRNRGELDRAEQVIAEARRVAPDYWLVYNYSALVALARNDLDQAVNYVDRSMALKSNMQAVMISGMIYEARKAMQVPTQPTTQPTALPPPPSEPGVLRTPAKYK